MTKEEIYQLIPRKKTKEGFWIGRTQRLREIENMLKWYSFEQSELSILEKEVNLIKSTLKPDEVHHF